MYSSSRRNFICRMKCGDEVDGTDTVRGKEKRVKVMDDEYAVVHCTGYIKVSVSASLNTCVKTMLDFIGSLVKISCGVFRSDIFYSVFLRP